MTKPPTGGPPSATPVPAASRAETAAAPAAPVISSGEKTPWQGDPGFPVADNWMLVDPRWVRKGIPRWLHYVLLGGWALFIGFLLFLYFFHTPGTQGFHEHPPAGLPGSAPAPAPDSTTTPAP